MLEDSLSLLKPNGRLVMVGYIAGYPHNEGGGQESK
jgi:NADPH-dependent curcumin reductase CurA